MPPSSRRSAGTTPSPERGARAGSSTGIHAILWRLAADQRRGAAGAAYRSWAQQQHDAIVGIAKAADAIATVTEDAGALIAAVRILVRDAIATAVFRIIVYAAELVAS